MKRTYFIKSSLCILIAIFLLQSSFAQTNPYATLDTTHYGKNEKVENI